MRLLFPEEILELKKADDRGRVYLGPNYREKKVKLAVLKVV